jgi:hypothetical protein
MNELLVRRFDRFFNCRLCMVQFECGKKSECEWCDSYIHKDEQISKCLTYCGLMIMRDIRFFNKSLTVTVCQSVIFLLFVFGVLAGGARWIYWRRFGICCESHLHWSLIIRIVTHDLWPTAVFETSSVNSPLTECQNHKTIFTPLWKSTTNHFVLCTVQHIFYPARCDTTETETVLRSEVLSRCSDLCVCWESEMPLLLKSRERRGLLCLSISEKNEERREKWREKL